MGEEGDAAVCAEEGYRACACACVGVRGGLGGGEGYCAGG